MLLKTLIATLFVIGVAFAEQSPVFLWGVNRETQPALQTVSETAFATTLAELLQDHMVVAFQENGLTSKDFLCSNVDTTESCYAQLQGVSPKTYYTSVENPAGALRLAAKKREHTHVNEHGQLADEIECAAGKAVFVSFDDAKQQARENTLEAHDSAISSITKQLKCKVAYLYMAAPGSNGPSKLNRQRREAGVPVSATAAADGGYIFREKNQFLIFFEKLTFSSDGTKAGTTELKITGITVSNTTTSTQFSVSLNAENGKPVTFDIAYTSDGYFAVSNVVYDTYKFFSQNINSLTTFSYFCGQLTLGAQPSDGVNSPATLVFSNLQMQAPFNANTQDNFVFGDPWHCVGFFSPAILAGLFVVILLLIILFTGICWMMDINTMDRFDDPKGKTITINQTD